MNVALKLQTAAISYYAINFDYSIYTLLSAITNSVNK